MSEIKYDDWLAELDRLRGIDSRCIVWPEEAEKTLLYLRDAKHGRPLPWVNIAKEYKKRYGFGNIATLKKKYSELIGK